MIDVGGQRSERRKWIHFFQGVHAVLFIAAINEFNQTHYEDEQKNRLTESLELFRDICRNQYFAETAMILFLNKRDLFDEKIRSGANLSLRFPEFTGWCSSDNYLEQKKEFLVCSIKILTSIFF